MVLGIVFKGDTGIECNQMHMPEMLRCLKGDTRKGSLWLPLKERLSGLDIKEIEEDFPPSNLRCSY